MMAVSGGATTAYVCQVSGYELTVAPTTRLRTNCATVDHALEVLARGESVVVAGSDMAALRTRLQGAGVEVAR